jgi:3-oxoacyl-[acyl-carrier-protein] synthase III
MEERINENSLVLVYTNGASATAAATVMRWGDVALGNSSIEGLEVRRGRGEVVRSCRVSISQEKVLAAEPEKKLEIVEIYLKEWLSDSLQLPIDKFDSEQPLAIWLDSLLAFLLRSRIENDLGVRVSIENFFGDNNLASLTQQILDRLILQDLKISESVDRDSEREKLSL